MVLEATGEMDGWGETGGWKTCWKAGAYCCLEDDNGLN